MRRLLSSSFARSFHSVNSNPLNRLRVVSVGRSPLLQYQPQHNYTTTELNMAKDKGEGKGGGYTLKVPKGTKDWDGKDMVIREKIFSTISEVFKRHGGVTIDTLVNDPENTRLEHSADQC